MPRPLLGILAALALSVSWSPLCLAQGRPLDPAPLPLDLDDDLFPAEDGDEPAPRPRREAPEAPEVPSLGPAPALAGSDELGPSLLIEEFELNEATVVYSAARKLQSRYDAPAPVYVFTDSEIETMGARTLGDVLRQVPGVEVRSWMSGYENVMIRGMLGSEVVSTRILWLEEGVSFNDVRDGGVWLDESFPLDLIKRIEVILGPGSALYGTNAFQGVVNIYYKDAESLPDGGQYRASYGSFGRRTASATVGHKGEGVSLLFHASGGSTDGPGLIAESLADDQARQQSFQRGQGCSFALQEAEQVCAQQGEGSAACAAAQARSLEQCGGQSCHDATLQARTLCAAQGLGSAACEKARHDAAGPCAVAPSARQVSSRRAWVNLRASARVDPLRVSLGFRHVDANFDGALFFPNNYYEFGHQELFANALLNRDLGPSLNFKVIGSFRLARNLFRSYSDYRISEIMPGGALATPEILDLFPADFAQKIDYDIDQYKGGLTVQSQWDVFPGASWGANELIAGAGLRYEAIDSPELMVGKRDQAFTNASVYAQDELRLLSDRLLLTLGGRLDTHNEYDAVVSYRGAALLKPLDSLRLRLSAGSAFKEPAMWQLYIDHIDAQGNPDLKPERLVNVEGGISWQPLEPLELRLDGFATWMSDIIENRFDPSLAIPELGPLGHPHFGRFHPTQTDREAFLAGGEASLRLRVAAAWDAGVSYAYLHTDDGTGEPLPYDYPHKVGLFFLRQGQGARGSLRLFWVSSTTDTGSDPAVEVPAYWLCEARSQIELVGGLALGVDARFVISDGLHDTDRHLSYDEMSQVPVPRYVLSTDLAYPF